MQSGPKGSNKVDSMSGKRMSWLPLKLEIHQGGMGRKETSEPPEKDVESYDSKPQPTVSLPQLS